MPGDNVRKEPTLDEQMATVKGFSTENGEVLDPAKENLNPVSTGVSSEEAIAGATVITEPAVELKGAETDADKAAADKEKQDKAQPKPGKTVDARIAEVTKARRTAERQLAEERGARAAEKEAFEKRLAALEKSRLTPTGQPATSETDDDPTAPQASKYEYGELDPKFIRDLARHEAKKELAAERATQETEQKTAKQTAAQTELMEQAKVFEDTGVAAYDDFEDVVIAGARAGDWDLTQTLGSLILGSPETGVHIAYHLASNPDESKKVAKLSPLEQTKWYARKEIELSADSVAADGKPKQPAGSQAQKPQSKTPITKAPAPPANGARRGQSTTQVSADTQDFAAFEAMATETRN